MKYLIKWNAGYGHDFEVIDANDQSEADDAAYQSWKQAAEMEADYIAEPLTAELCDEYNIDPEEHGLEGDDDA